MGLLTRNRSQEDTVKELHDAEQRKSALARLATLESRLEGVAGRLETIAEEVGDARKLARQVGRIDASVSACEQKLSATAAELLSMVENAHAAARGAQQAAAGAKGGRSSKIDREAAELGAQITQAMSTPEGFEQMIREMGESYQQRFGNGAGRGADSPL